MKFLILPKKIFLTVFLALIALFLATGYFLIFKKDKILEALSVQNFSLQNLSPASVSQFGVNIIKAEKLDEDKNQVEDVFKKVQAKDNVWAVVGSNEYLKMTFAKPLTKENDITIFAKIDGENQEVPGNKVEVYTEDNTKIAEFAEIKHARSYKVVLANLKTPTNTFYLKVIGNIAFDYVVDPAEAGIAFTGGMQFSTGVDIIKPWACGDTLTDSRDNKTYATILIGTQCWMAENLNVGTKLFVASYPQGTNCDTASAIQKYCQADSDANCTTYGGLYEWNQAMCGSTTAGAKGICPTGWHIPTHDEITTLERAVCTSGTCATDFPFDASTEGDRGTDEGTKLKAGGSSGFNNLLGGSSYNGHFASLEWMGYFWSSLQSDSTFAWYRDLWSGDAQIGRHLTSKANGLSIRCVKDAD